MAAPDPIWLSPAQINALLAEDGIGTKAAERAVARLRFVASDVDDVTQEIRFHLWKKLRKYNQGRGCLEAYVARIAKNKAINLLRGRCADYRRQARLRDELPRRNGRGHTKIDLAEFDRVLSGLPDDLRILCQVVLERGTIQAVALELGISRAAVRNRLSSLREPFRAVCEDYARG
jgi:RNA polymerase sigma factor (sigma-70 family)